MLESESVSVVIPVFNGEKYLAEAIESVLQQTVQPLEIIVIDDGSTDGTKAVAKEFEGYIRYVYQKNSGVAVARNRGLKQVRGDLISFIDADDIWVNNKLEMQLNLFKKKPEYEMIIGLLCRAPVSETKKVLEQERLKGEFVIQLGCTLLKKEVFEMIGNFDEKMTLGEDVDLFLRVLESEIKVWGHADVVQIYRQHDQNITNDRRRTDYYLLKAFKKSLERRRKGGKNHADTIPSFDNMSEIIKNWQNHDQS